MIIKLRFKVFILALVLVPAFYLNAEDFGIHLDQNFSYGGIGSDSNIDYSAALIPRFSVLIGNNSDFNISAFLKLEKADENWNWSLIPELLRTEISIGFGDIGKNNNLAFKAGRMQYADPLGFIANGLFDGAEIYFDTGETVINAGVWYTGLLYKKRANVTMTEEEHLLYDRAVDSSNFSNTYFAPRRILWALGWEDPALNETIFLKLGVLGQFDLSDSSLNSQYFAAKASIPSGNFIFDLGCSVAIIQDKDDYNLGIAGELGAAWMIPASFDSRLAFLGRFSSGVIKKDSIVRDFLPITTSFQGDLLKARLPGISTITLDYLARLHNTFSFGLSASYFVQSDLATFTGYPVNEAAKDGHFLGAEAFGRFLWGPLSDIHFSLGAGAFLPSLGNAAPEAEAIWRIELNTIFSLY